MRGLKHYSNFMFRVAVFLKWKRNINSSSYLPVELNDENIFVQLIFFFT